MTNVGVDLGEQKRNVEPEPDFAPSHRLDRRGAAPKRPAGYFLRRGVDGLPAPVTRRQVRSGHPHVVPHVEVPNRVVAVLAADSLLAVGRKELVDGQTRVGVVRGDEVGHRSAGDAQSSEYGGGDARKHPTLTEFNRNFAV